MLLVKVKRPHLNIRHTFIFYECQLTNPTFNQGFLIKVGNITQRFIEETQGVQR
jgi:hypothetical protein